MLGFFWSDKKEEKARGFWLVQREHIEQKRKKNGFLIFAILVMLLVPPSKIKKTAAKVLLSLS